MDSEIVKQNEEVRDLEVLSLRKRVSELESQLEEAKKLIQKHLLEANEVDLLKMKSADTLTKAKSVIFENTKMIKNQELQIEALNQQVESLRDVVTITKELLGIRNLEVDQLESKIHCMEEKHKAEKERQDLMHKRLEQMIRHNGDLKREYETQLCLFKALRERYDERELAKGVVNTLKSDIKIEKEKELEQKNVVENQSQEEAKEKKNDSTETATTDSENSSPLQSQNEKTDSQEICSDDPKHQKAVNDINSDSLNNNTCQRENVNPKEISNQQECITTTGTISNEKQENASEESKIIKTEDQSNLDSNSVKQ